VSYGLQFNVRCFLDWTLCRHVCDVDCTTTVVGLTMTVNIQQYEYVTQAGDTAGIAVVILPQNQMPFPEDDGILVSPGHATSIGILQVSENEICSLLYVSNPICLIQTARSIQIYI